MRLSVVIPTLNAAASLPETLSALDDGDGLVAETVVSDGGSTDGTVAFARARGCKVASGAKGRGGQLARGAEAASGDWLLFLHADTVLSADWSEAVRRHMADAPGQAAVFRFALDDPSPAARRLERMVAWRVKLLALPYGDQGLLIARALYDAVGGFSDLPLMEDVELIGRIGRRRLAALPAVATTSAARYLRDGYLRRMARNAGCLSLYFLGVSPRRIARIYG